SALSPDHAHAAHPGSHPALDKDRPCRRWERASSVRRTTRLPQGTDPPGCRGAVSFAGDRVGVMVWRDEDIRKGAIGHRAVGIRFERLQVLWKWHGALVPSLVVLHI